MCLHLCTIFVDLHLAAIAPKVVRNKNKLKTEPAVKSKPRLTKLIQKPICKEANQTAATEGQSKQSVRTSNKQTHIKNNLFNLASANEAERKWKVSTLLQKRKCSIYPVKIEGNGRELYRKTHALC